MNRGGLNPLFLDAVPLRRLTAAVQAEREWRPVAPASKQPVRRVSRLAALSRILPVLMLGFTFLAISGLIASISHVLANEGRVSTAEWLRLAMTGLLVAMVVSQLLTMVRQTRIGRWMTQRFGRGMRDGQGGNYQTRPAVVLDMVPMAALLRRARPDIGEPDRGAIAAARTRSLAGLLTWWPLVVAVLILGMAGLVGSGYWLIRSLVQDGPGMQLALQLPVLAFAALAPVFVLRMARASWSNRRRRHRRRLLRRLLRFLGFGRDASGWPGTPGAGALQFASRAALVSLAASGAFVLGAWPLNPGSADNPGESAVLFAITATPTPTPFGGGVVVPAQATPAPEATSDPSADTPTATTAATETRAPVTPTPVPPAFATLAPTIAATAPASPTPSPSPTQPPTATATLEPSPTPQPTNTPTTAPTPTATFQPSPTPTPQGCTVDNEPDADCDGVADSVEKQYGSLPEDPSSTPESADYDVKYNQSTCSDNKDNDGNGETDLKDQKCSL